MVESEQIASLMKEAKLYQSQGLLEESKDRYVKVLKLIEGSRGLKDQGKLIANIQKKIQSVDRTINEIEEAPSTPELSGDLHTLIGKLFAFSRDHDKAAAERAVALAKFGQYEKAIEEFNRMLEEDVMPMDAAKNILACHMTFSSPEAAVAQFQRWISREILAKEKLAEIREYLRKMLAKKGIQAKLPQLTKTSPRRQKEDDEEGLISVSTVNVQLETGPLKGQTIELDVASQSENTISILVPESQQDLIQSFKLGSRFNEMQCFSTSAFFRCNGIAFGKTKIESGPKQGNYVLEIMIEED
jgi:tetratricopeptide (TPR) repeat protein